MRPGPSLRMLFSFRRERRDIRNGNFVRRPAHCLPVEIFYVLAALDASEQMYARTDIPERGPARVLPPYDAGKIVASPVEPVDREHQITDLPSHRRGAAVRAFAERARQLDLVDPYGRLRRRQLTGEHTDDELAALAAVVVERAYLARNADEPRA